MVLGARDTLSKGMVLVYRSMDLTNWEYFNRITTEQTFGYMWECLICSVWTASSAWSAAPRG